MSQLPVQVTNFGVIGVIGGGTMAKAILFPLFDKKILDPTKVIVGGNTAKSLEAWAAHGCTTFSNQNDKVFEQANVIMWAVKPQVFPTAAVAADFKSMPDRLAVLHISVMGGIPVGKFTKQLATWLGCTPPTIRTMPNIGHRVGAGCTVFTKGQEACEDDVNVVKSLFSPTGICLEVPESQMNGFSALTGSGVGFMFPVLEALSDGAVKVGIPRDVALEMAAQTMKGAAELYLAERTHPGPLKDCVCSPGGSTIVGIAELEKIGVRIGFINAIDAAHKRSEELGKL